MWRVEGWVWSFFFKSFEVVCERTGRQKMSEGRERRETDSKQAVRLHRRFAFFFLSLIRSFSLSSRDNN